MRKSTQILWVKNVHNLGILPGINSGILSTPLYSPSYNPQIAAYNSLLIPAVFPVSSSLRSTAVFNYFNLLLSHLSPLSTAPINKTKKKKERK
jgi:hypothetical protein